MTNKLFFFYSNNLFKPKYFFKLIKHIHLTEYIVKTIDYKNKYKAIYIILALYWYEIILGIY